MQEEEAEKTLVRAEIEANKAIKMIQEKKSKRKKKRNGPPEPDTKSRNWFQSQKDRKDGKHTFIVVSITFVGSKNEL